MTVRIVAFLATLAARAWAIEAGFGMAVVLWGVT